LWPPEATTEPEPPAPATPPGLSTPRIAPVRMIAMVAVGIGLLTLLLLHAGIDDIHDRIDLGWTSALILLPWLVIACCYALGWRCTLPPAVAGRIPFRSLVMVRMAGEAVNNVTPTAAVGGEPVKAHLLRGFGVSGADSMASIVIAKTALTVSQSLFVVLGIAALCDRSGRPGLGVALLALLLLVTAGFTIVLMRLQRRNPAMALWRGLRRIMPRAGFVDRLRHGAQAVDARLAEFYRIERTAFWRAGWWHLLGWLLGIGEVMLIMVLIGAPVSWLDALIIEALSQPIRAAAVIIPGGIGTQEVGGVALCNLIGIPEADSATLWLLKRGRELVFDAIGLLYLARRSTLQRRGG
jgi:putative membrane protein